MLPRMRTLVVVLLLLQIVPALIAVEPSEKAGKYHAMLMKRPKPGAIMERFISAWLEDGDLASLRVHLLERAGRADAAAEDQMILGFFLAAQSEHQDAIAVFQKALARDAKNAEAWLYLAQEQERLLRLDDALVSVEHLKDATGETAITGAKLRARLLARTGRTKEALETLKSLADAHPDDQDLQDEVVDMHVEEGLQSDAVDVLTALIQRTVDPYQRVLRRLRLGDILQRVDRREDALAAYAQCLDDAAQDSWVEGEVLAQIEHTFRLKDDVAGLLDHLSKLAEKHSHRVALGLLRARVQIDSDKGEEALTLVREMLQRNPGHALLKESFIDMLARLQKFDEAAVQTRELLAKRSQDHELRIRLSTLLYQAKKPGEAMHELEPLIADAKTPEFNLLRVARLYEGFDDPQEARKLYQRCAETYPQSTSALDAFASFLHSHNAAITAVEMWRKQAAAPAPKEDVLRVARALGSRMESDAALDVLVAREKEFAQDADYLTQLLVAANGAQRADLARGWVLALVRMATQQEPVDEALRQARTVFRDEKERTKLIVELKARTDLSLSERCLLADMLELSGDPAGADVVLSGGERPALIVRQHARLYAQRQDFEKAASVLEPVADKDAGILEQLVSLWQRAGKPDVAGKWIARWREVLPGSIRPMFADARNLQAQHREADAIKVLKLAAQKFPDDSSARTALAEAYGAAGQGAEAQRIYQTLYDEATDGVARLRWAGMLGQTAQTRGTLKELITAFQERQKANRTSVTPWLALAEIHRRTNNYEGRRDALLEALRLKAGDIDLLHQIAQADEDQGEWRRAIETLEGAAKLDKTPKSRRKIAELHLRYGDEETGMRMAFELAGGADADPRDTEDMAVSLMVRANWKGAMSVIEPVLEHHPDDYRLSYLRALCLVENEQVDDALNEFVALMGARVEVMTPSKNVGTSMFSPMMDAPQDIDPKLQMMQAISGAAGMALNYRSQIQQMGQGQSRFSSVWFINGYSGGGSKNPFLPAVLQMVKPMVTAILVDLKQSQNWSADKVKDVVRRIGAGGHPVPEAVTWFEIAGQRGGGLRVPSAVALAEIDNEGLIRYWLNQQQSGSGDATLAQVRARLAQVQAQLAAKGIQVAAGNQISGAAADAPDEKLLNAIYERYQAKQPELAVMAMLVLWRTNPAKNVEAMNKAMALEPALPMKNPAEYYAYAGPLRDPAEGFDLKGTLARKLADTYLRALARYREKHPEIKGSNASPWVYQALGDWPGYVAELERAFAASDASRLRGSSWSGTPYLNFQNLTVYDVQESAASGAGMMVSEVMPSGYTRNRLGDLAPADAAALKAAAEGVKNPDLRLLLAWRLGDMKAIAAAAKDEMKVEKPRSWVLMLSAHVFAEDEPAFAARALAKARGLVTRSDIATKIECALLKLYRDLRESKSAEAADLAKDAQAAALNLRRVAALGQSYSQQQLAEMMDAIGMEDEARRMRKMATSVKASRSFVSSMAVTQQVDPYQLQQEIRTGKQASAIPKAVRALQQTAAQLATSGGSQQFGYEVQRWAYLVNEVPAAAAEMWKSLTKTEPSTLKQQLERAVLAEIFGKSGVAVQHYEEALKSRPRDNFIRARLALQLMRDVETQDRALDLLRQMSPADLSSGAALSSLFDLDRGQTLGVRLTVAQTIIRYVREAKSKARPGDLEWCSRVTDLLVSGSYGAGGSVPSLFEKKPGDGAAQNELIVRRRKLFDEWCLVAVDVPELAYHLVPAMVGVAEAEERDGKPFIDDARRALAMLAALRNGTHSWSVGNNWEESFNGSFGSPRRLVKALPLLLFDDARSRKTLDAFVNDSVPMIRLAYGGEVARDFSLRAKLWTCSADEFESAVKELQSLQRQGGNNVADPKTALEIVIARKLEFNPDELMTAYVRDRVRQGYGMDEPTVAAYFESIARRPYADQVRALKALIAAGVGKPESEWSAWVQNRKPGPTGTANSLSRLASGLRALVEGWNGKSLCRWITSASILGGHGFLELDELRYPVLERSFDATNPTEPSADVVHALEETPFLKDLADFDPIVVKGTRSNGERMVFTVLIRRLKGEKDDWRVQFSDALAKREGTKPAFGSMVLRGHLAPISPDIVASLQPHDEAFGRLAEERRDAVLSVVRGLWRDFDSTLRKPGQAGSLKAFGAGIASAVETESKKVLSAKSPRDIASSDSSVAAEIVKSVASILPTDEDKALQTLRHGVGLIQAAQNATSWAGIRFGNGFNVESDMLEKICGSFNKAEISRRGGDVSLAALRLMSRVCLDLKQQAFYFPYAFREPAWGETLHEAWSRAGGYGDPRGATRKLLASVQQAMGDAPLTALPIPFSDFAGKLPAWYESVVRDEAGRIALGQEALRAVAAELAIGMGCRKHTASALEVLRDRVKDESVNQLLRAEFAALFCDYTPGTPSPADMKLCMDVVSALLEADGPGTSAVWEGVIGVFNRQPASVEWDELAARFRKAWLQRARFNTMGSKKDFMGLRPFRTSCLHVLGTFARSADAADLKAFADLYIENYRDYVATRLMLARHDARDVLKNVMLVADGTATEEDTSNGIAFRDSDLAALDNIDKAVSDPALQLLARAQAASVRDSSWQQPKIRREMRLADEARRLQQSTALSPEQRKRIEAILLDSFDAARVLAPGWMKEHKAGDELKSALGLSDYERRKAVKEPLILALARLCDGDSAPWKECLTVLRERVKAGPGHEILDAVSYACGIACTRHLAVHGVADSGWIISAARDLIDLVPDSEKSNPMSEMVSLWLVVEVISGDTKSFDAWREGLSEQRAKLMQLNSTTWVSYELATIKVGDGEDGAQTLLALLKHPLAAKILNSSSALSYRDKPISRLAAESTRRHASELLQALPQSQGLVLSVMNAWAGLADQKPLAAALEGIKDAAKGRSWLRDYRRAVDAEVKRQ